MSIVNKRNAVLGWGIWQVAKATAKRKARETVKPEERNRRRGKGAILPALAATGGAVWFWRRRRSNDDES